MAVGTILILNRILEVSFLKVAFLCFVTISTKLRRGVPQKEFVFPAVNIVT